MTYGELKNLKTAGFVTNHVIDDALGNARWCNKYGALPTPGGIND